MTNIAYSDMFAGISVTDFKSALEWYERLLGVSPSFFPNDIEAVWELAEHRYVYIVQRPEHAGHAVHLIFVDNLDTLVARLAEANIHPVEQETHENSVRKMTYRDPDGNEFAFGGMG